MEKELVTFINDTFSLQVHDSNYAEMKLLLSSKINDWIIHDFSKLIHVLYRIDVSEKKINQLLQENILKDASDILADLIIERQMQKIESKRNTPPYKNGSSEEAW